MVLCLSLPPLTSHLFLCEQEVICFNAKLKILEHRQQRIAEVRAKYEWLMKELEATKQYLMLDPNKWLRECKAHWCMSILATTVVPSNTIWEPHTGTVCI